MKSGAAGRRIRFLKTIGATQRLDGFKNNRGGITRKDQHVHGKVFRRWRLYYAGKEIYFSAARYGTVAEAKTAAEKKLAELRRTQPTQWNPPKACMMPIRKSTNVDSSGLERNSVAGLHRGMYMRPGSSDAASFVQGCTKYRTSYGWNFFSFQEGDRLLKVGSCVGAVEAIAAQMGVTSILGVESDLGNFQVLYKNAVLIAKNTDKLQFHVVHAALHGPSAPESVLTVARERKGCRDTSRSRLLDFASVLSIDTPVSFVPTLTFATLRAMDVVDHRCVGVIDIEGSEFLAFKQMKGAPPYIVFEFHRREGARFMSQEKNYGPPCGLRAQRAALRYIWALLSADGYLAHHVSAGAYHKYLDFTIFCSRDLRGRAERSCPQCKKRAELRKLVPTISLEVVARSFRE